MKILEQFFHFCIVCWTLAGFGAIGSVLNFPHPDNYLLWSFISLTVLGIIGREVSSVVYYGKKSKLSIAYGVSLYTSLIWGLIYIDAFLFAFSILILGVLVLKKLLFLNDLAWRGLLRYQYYLELMKEVRIRFMQIFQNK